MSEERMVLLAGASGIVGPYLAEESTRLGRSVRPTGADARDVERARQTPQEARSRVDAPLAAQISASVSYENEDPSGTFQANFVSAICQPDPTKLKAQDTPGMSAHKIKLVRARGLWSRAPLKQTSKEMLGYWLRCAAQEPHDGSQRRDYR